MSSETVAVPSSNSSKVNWKYIETREKNPLTDSPNLGVWGWIPGVTAAVASMKIVLGAGSAIESICKIACSFFSYAFDSLVASSKKDEKALAERKFSWLQEIDDLSGKLTQAIDTVAMNILYAVPFLGYYAQKTISVLDLALQTLLQTSPNSSSDDGKTHPPAIEMAQLRQRIDELQGAIHDKDGEVDRLNTLNKNLSERIAALETSLKDAAFASEMHKQKLAITVIEKENIEKSIKKLDELIQEKESSLEEVRKQNGSFAEKLTLLEQSAKEKDVLVAENTEKLAKLGLERNALAEQIKSLNQLLEEKKGEMDGTERIRQELQTKIISHQQELSSKDEEIKKLSFQNQTFAAEHSNLKKMIDDYKGQLSSLAKLRDEASGWKDKYTGILSLQTKLQAELSDHVKARGQLELDVASYKGQVAQLNSDISESEKQRQRLQEELASLKRQGKK